MLCAAGRTAKETGRSGPHFTAAQRRACDKCVRCGSEGAESEGERFSYQEYDDKKKSLLVI